KCPAFLPFVHDENKSGPPEQNSMNTTLAPCPVWFGGEWRNVHSVPPTPVHNPSTGDVIAETPLCPAAHVNEAVEAAAAAFPAWMETPAVERARVLFKFKTLLEENFDD